jgi:hypothetical protein
MLFLFHTVDFHLEYFSIEHGAKNRSPKKVEWVRESLYSHSYPHPLVFTQQQNQRVSQGLSKHSISKNVIVMKNKLENKRNGSYSIWKVSNHCLLRSLSTKT